MNVELKTSEKVQKELTDLLSPIIKENGMIIGKNRGGYGDLFTLKIEAFRDGGVSVALGKKVMNEKTFAAVKKILEKNSLELSKSRWTYGDHFALSIKATAIEINEKGVNIKSEDAETFILFAWQYNLTESALGTVGTYAGEKYILHGAKKTGRGDSSSIKWLVKDESGVMRYLLREDAISIFGGKPIETVSIPFTPRPRGSAKTAGLTPEAKKLIKDAEDSIQTY